MNNSPLDAGIPVLTQVIPTPAETRQAQPIPAPAIDDDMVALERQAVFDWDEQKWERLEREIRERILQQILERVDVVLEQRVRDSLADVLQLAVEELATEIRGGLHHTIKDVVSRAVSQEITRLQTTKK